MRMITRAVRLLPMAMLIPLGLGLGGCDAYWGGDPEPDELVVFAAASTAEPLAELSARYEQQTGRHVRFHFAASSTLANQVVGGASADVFLSANASWMDHVIEQGVVDPASRRALLTNRLVIVTPTGLPIDIQVEPDFDFSGSFTGKLAMGDPSHVPAGMYAREAMQTLGWWGAVEHRVQPASNVRSAMRLVELGEVKVGWVYATDARASRRVMVSARVPGHLHAPIVYHVALTTTADPEAMRFVDFLAGEEAAPVWRQAGFSLEVDDASG